MYTLGLDTIAGAKLLQVKFGRAGVLSAEPSRDARQQTRQVHPNH
jgi:hypothetical protein